PARLLLEGCEPRENFAETWEVAILMIQFRRGSWIDDTHTAGRTIREGLIGHFRVGKEGNGVPTAVDQLRRGPGRPVIGVVVHQCTTKRVVGIRSEVRLEIRTENRDGIPWKCSKELRLSVGSVQQRRQRMTIPFSEQLLE